LYLGKTQSIENISFRHSSVAATIVCALTSSLGPLFFRAIRMRLKLKHSRKSRSLIP
jgi:hypothetical protein